MTAHRYELFVCYPDYTWSDLHFVDVDETCDDIPDGDMDGYAIDKFIAENPEINAAHIGVYNVSLVDLEEANI
jgi:hypothetical protein